jgi:divalent metal cation (Fe/Co/Zn/Cd) transporter
MVHTEPLEDNPSDAGILAKTIAQQFDMAAHNVRCTDTGARVLELHLEVDRSLSLQAAHDRVSRFEDEFLKKCPDFGKVISHIEPVATATSSINVDKDLHAFIRKVANKFFKDNHISCDTHEVSVSRSGHLLSISLHCAMEGHISIVDAHDLSTRLEQYLHTQVPILGNVTIHVEPSKTKEK